MDDKITELPEVVDFAQQLLNTAKDMKDFAFKHYEARKVYAKCFNKITIMICKAKLYDNRASFENKIPMLFAHPQYSGEAIQTASTMNEARQEYRGLEMILKAYQAEISGLQSIIKFMQQGEMVEAVKNKYESGVYE